LVCATSVAVVFLLTNGLNTLAALIASLAAIIFGGVGVQSAARIKSIIELSTVGAAGSSKAAAGGALAAAAASGGGLSAGTAAGSIASAAVLTVAVAGGVGAVSAEVTPTKAIPKSLFSEPPPPKDTVYAENDLQDGGVNDAGQSPPEPPAPEVLPSSSSSVSPAPSTLMNACTPSGQRCSPSDTCCSPLDCVDGICRCRKAGEKCTMKWSCCSQLCENGLCAPCRALDTPCDFSDQCCSRRCDKSSGTGFCTPKGALPDDPG
jgi:hypothetical protein